MTKKINNLEIITFPQYRMYLNAKSYFKILSPINFEEKLIVGKKTLVKTCIAEQYPEKLFIRDLLVNFSHMAKEITEETYNSIK
jgi:hypothetical protein